MSSLPAYRRVYRDLKEAILAGQYKVATMLPTESELENIYGVSRTTIRRAVFLLKNEGLVSVRQGAGTEVLSDQSLVPFYRKFHNIVDIKEMIANTPDNEKECVTEGMHVETVSAFDEVAQALELKEGERVYQLQRIVSVNDCHIAYTIDYIRTDTTPRLERFSGMISNLYQLMKDEYGINFEHGHETVSACVATFVEAQMLGVEIGAPLIACKRYAYCQKGPMEYLVTKLNPENYCLDIIMKGPPPFLR